MTSLLLKPKPKAKVVPMPPLPEEAGETPVYLLPEGFRYANNSPRNVYRHGFKAYRPMSNANKAGLATRRRTMIRAARNYGNSRVAAAAADGAGEAPSPRPKLVIPNNNGAAQGAAPAPNNHRAAPRMGAGLVAAAAAGNTAPPAAGNGFVNVNLGGGALVRRRPLFRSAKEGLKATALARRRRTRRRRT